MKYQQVLRRHFQALKESVGMHSSQLVEENDRESKNSNSFHSSLDVSAELVASPDVKRATSSNVQDFVAQSSSDPKQERQSEQETTSDVEELNKLLKDAAIEITQLKHQIKHNDKVARQQVLDMNSSEEKDDLMKQRLQNEVLKLRTQLDHELNQSWFRKQHQGKREGDTPASGICLSVSCSKDNKQKVNGLENMKEPNSLIHYNSSPPWVPDWYVDSCTSCGYSF